MRDAQDWMWSEALDMLARAERLHSQIFAPAQTHNSRPSWEPPVDVLESEKEVLIIAAVPGVSETDVRLVIDGSCLIIDGQRTVPPEFHTAKIHRLELPQGRFERRVPLPAGRYDQIQHRTLNGCLLVSLRKSA
jgi:HSP20 family molecular chaperone IbpA